MKRWLVIAAGLVILRVSLNGYSTSNIVPNQPFVMETVLTLDPKLGPSSQRIRMKSFDIVLPRYPELRYGDKIRVSIDKLSCQPYKQSANSKAARCTAVFPKIEIIGDDGGNWFIARITRLRQGFVVLLQKSLPQPEAGLVAGVAIGYKDGLTPNLRDWLRVSGLSHVAVASGMNIALIMGFLTKFIKRRNLLLIPVIWLYAVLAGFDPPVVRAGIMASLVIIAERLGRKGIGWWSLGAAGWLMIMVNPNLIYDLGFQLSILATLGVMATPKIESLGAFFLTAPVIILNMGSLSLIAIPANVLLLWVIAPLTILVMTFVFIGPLLAAPVYALSHFFVWAVEIVGSQKFWLLTDLKINPAICLGYYLLIFLLWQKTKSWWR